MKLLTIRPQFDNKQRLGQSPAFSPTNQMLKCDTVSFGIRVPHEGPTKEIRALSDEFVNYINEIGDCYQALCKKIKQQQKDAKAVTEDELAEAAKQFDESPNRILTFFENLKTKPKEYKDGFALYIDEDNESTAHLALEGKHPAIADAFLDFVKTLDTPIQEKFATMVDSSVANNLHLAIYHGRCDFAHKYLDFLEPLSSKTKAAVLLHPNYEGDSVLHLALKMNFPDIAKSILEFAKKLDAPDKESFSTLFNYDNKTHFQMALETREPEIATDYLKFVKGLEDKAKRRFIAHKETGYYLPKEGISQFETAAEDYPHIALDFLDFALDVAPKEVPSFKIPDDASMDFCLTTARKILACEKLEPSEKLTFLKNNNEERQFDEMITELEKQLTK